MVGVTATGGQGRTVSLCGVCGPGLNVESWWTGWLVLMRPGSRRRRGGTIVVENVPLIDGGCIGVEGWWG